jgi:hypothetical protein
MTWATPAPTEIPYAEDGDVRALLPATMQAQSERLHELLTPYYAHGYKVGGAAPAGGHDVDWAGVFGADPGTPLAYTGGGVITYTGPPRMFLITLQVQIGGVAGPLTSSAGIGSAPGVMDRQSTFSTDVGATGTAEHAHHLTMLYAMTSGDTIVAGVAAPGAGSAIAYDARLEFVGL